MLEYHVGKMLRRHHFSVTDMGNVGIGRAPFGGHRLAVVIG